MNTPNRSSAPDEERQSREKKKKSPERIAADALFNAIVQLSQSGKDADFWENMIHNIPDTPVDNGDGWSNFFALVNNGNCGVALLEALGDSTKNKRAIAIVQGHVQVPNSLRGQTGKGTDRRAFLVAGGGAVALGFAGGIALLFRGGSDPEKATVSNADGNDVIDNPPVDTEGGIGSTEATGTGGKVFEQVGLDANPVTTVYGGMQVAAGEGNVLHFPAEPGATSAEVVPSSQWMAIEGVPQDWRTAQITIRCTVRGRLNPKDERMTVLLPMEEGQLYMTFDNNTSLAGAHDVTGKRHTQERDFDGSIPLGVEAEVIVYLHRNNDRNRSIATGYSINSRRHNTFNNIVADPVSRIAPQLKPGQFALRPGPNAEVTVHEVIVAQLVPRS